MRSNVMLALSLIGVSAPTVGYSLPPAQTEVALPDPTGLKPGELWEKSINLMFDRRLSEIRPYADQLLLLVGQDPYGQSMALTMVGVADIGSGDIAMAQAKFDRANSLIADISTPLRVQYFAGLLGEHEEVSETAFDRMLTDAPAVIQEQEIDMIRSMLFPDEGEPQARHKERVIALADMRYGKDEYPWIYLEAAKYVRELHPSQQTKATEWIAKLEHPGLLQRALIERDFEPFWPAIERRLDGGLQGYWDRYIEKLKAKADDEPDERNTYLSYLLDAGDNETVLSVTDAILPDPSEYGSIQDENLAWLVNYRAMAFDASGRSDEGEALFKALVDGAKEDESKTWLVSMAINNVEMLVNNSHFEAAALALDDAAMAAERGGNSYAKQLVSRLRFCILTRAGGTAEDVAAARAAMFENADDALTATAEALLCAGDREAATKLMIQALKSPSEQSRAIENLQNFQMDRSDPSDWEVKLSELRNDPDLNAAFEEVARDLPTQFRLSHQLER